MSKKNEYKIEILNDKLSLKIPGLKLTDNGLDFVTAISKLDDPPVTKLICRTTHLLDPCFPNKGPFLIIKCGSCLFCYNPFKRGYTPPFQATVKDILARDWFLYERIIED